MDGDDLCWVQDFFFTFGDRFGCQWLNFCVKHEVETLFESQSEVLWWQ